MEERHHSYIIKTKDRIGRGGFGYVESVEISNVHGTICGDYAKKILSPKTGVNIEDFRRRFKREVDYQAKCVHSNIVPIYLHNLNVENPWFVMELAESDLNKDLKKGIDLAKRFDIALMLLSGVKYMHDELELSTRTKPAYWHRDLKPSNILRFKNGVYKISDFGLVKNGSKDGASEVLTNVASAMGTKHYMAPEVITAGLYSAQSDIFALGVIIDELDLPEMKKLVDKCTAWKPASRYNHVDEIIVEIEQSKHRNIL